MKSYHKYVTVSSDDARWGLYVVDAGINQVPPHAQHPLPDHPAKYRFTWEKGRSLQEYQLIYLTKGEGVFESQETALEDMQAGTAMVLFPGHWHRYHPDPSTGWTTHWVGFRGPFADHLVREDFFEPEQPLLNIGYNSDLVSIFIDILELLKAERPGFQHIAGSEVLLILGHIRASLRELPFRGTDVEQTIEQARILFNESIGEGLTPKDVARKLNVGYSWFRKTFKQYTGTPPGQYQLQLRRQRARELLHDPSKSIKEVAFELGFGSQAYFTRMFKKKMGVTPGVFRKQALGERPK